MADPLSLLRDATVSGSPGRLEGDDLVIGVFRFHRSTKTFWKGQRGDFYSLDALWFLWKHKDLRHAVYMLKCQQEGFSAVSLVDRRGVLPYLSGDIDTHASIIKSGDLSTTTAAGSASGVAAGSTTPAGTKRSSDTLGAGASTAPSAKRAAVSDPAAGLVASTSAATGASEGVIVIGDDNDVPLSDKQVMAGILARERVHATRTSVLLGRRDFTDAISAAKPQKVTSKKKLLGTVLQSGRDRYDPATQTGAQSLEMPFQIETTGSNLSGGGVVGAPPAFPSAADSAFPAPGMSSSSSSLSSSLASRRAPPSSASRMPPARGGGILPPTGMRQRASSSSSSKRRSASQRPIIVVPTAPSSLLNMFNIKEFLESGKYITPDEAKKQGKSRAEKEMVVHRSARSGEEVTFEVVADPLRVKDADVWDRIVAVVAHGAQWQFKGWLWTSPVDVFSQVKGFHFAFDDTAVNPSVQQWDVEIVKLSKTKRHLDSQHARKFWQSLETYLLRTRSDTRLRF